ncbi:peptidoglycan-binding protein [Sphingomonas sp.]|uniref:peptidoglycan-binding protein n=1 Tax=Sphingomonas sp. TaxID=28214 RepID=UPI0028A5FF4F|nr:peptidoglycan-binding protein [Sphingomonas sp.]
MSALTQIYWLTSPMMRSDEVWKAQTLLAAKGARVRADGIYGRETAEAVRAFQARANLKSDAVLGPMTWAALNGETAAAPSGNGDTLLSPDALAALTRFHRRYPGGSEWRLTAQGIDVDRALAPFSVQERALVDHLLADYGVAIASVTRMAPVPLELVIATIATESSGKVNALRFEPGCDRIVPERTPRRVSMGLMQTLLSTAREALDQPDLKVQDLAVAETSIRAGMLYMWRQSRRTAFDPPLVAAAYNAGNVIFNSGAQNRWRVKQYPIGTGHHVDRFIRYFNAAMVAVGEGVVTVPLASPSFARLLRGAPAGGPPPLSSAPAGTTADAVHVAALIAQGTSEEGMRAARQTATDELAARGLPPYPKNACAVHLSALLQQAGIDVPMIAGAGKLAATLEKRGWRRVAVRQQQPGDIGVCFDNDHAIPGSDHVYLVVERIDEDAMMISDNQAGTAPHHRFATGRGKTPTEYFLRA